ncbi:hypothetical protein [Kitasatospora sp. NBC_00315]|uniref:hypothetical protein n=1 Tax=Kitasatospora sp. NBC_00315 TaxID=2975963 RepID=UPI003243BC33
MRVIPTQWRPSGHPDGETVLQQDLPESPDQPDEPIFDELARRWDGAGRTVPGRPDREWTSLVSRPAWPHR